MPSIAGHALRSLLRAEWPACNVFISDGDDTTYARIDPAHAWGWLQKADYHLYSVPLWDCDDIAFAAMIAARKWGRDKAKLPPAFGVAFRPATAQLPGHYFCFFVGLDGALHTLDGRGQTMGAHAYGKPMLAFA